MSEEIKEMTNEEAMKAFNDFAKKKKEKEL